MVEQSQKARLNGNYFSFFFDLEAMSILIAEVRGMLELAREFSLPECDMHHIYLLLSEFFIRFEVSGRFEPSSTRVHFVVVVSLNMNESQRK